MTPDFSRTIKFNADTKALDIISKSVLTTGMLPNPSIVKGEIADFSALGCRSRQITSLRSFRVEVDQSGRLAVVHDHYRVDQATNRPRRRGKEANPCNFSADLIAGFQSAYNIIERNKEVLMSTGGMLCRFRNVEVRVLLRDTDEYVSLLRASYHPSALHDGVERDRVLSQLWSGRRSRPYLNEAVASEFWDLRKGDVPFFRSVPSSCKTYADRKNRSVCSSLHSGYVVARNKLSNFSQNDLRLQTNLIVQALNTLGSGQILNDIIPIKSHSPIHIAKQIGDFLLSNAIIVRDEATWITARTLDDARNSEFRSGPVTLLGTGLYDGFPGVILFLLYLSAATGDKRYSILAEAGARTLHRRISSGELNKYSGAFDGLAGVIYTYCHLASVLNDRYWIRQALKLRPIVLSLLQREQNLDLISGVSGSLLCLLALDTLTGSSGISQDLVDVGKYLMCSWRGSLGISTFKRGASHGLSGVMLCASRVVKHIDIREDFAEIVKEEIALTKGGDWTDPFDDMHVGQSTWCHGAVGVAICRATAFNNSGFSLLKDASLLALEACVSFSVPEALGLCHGVSGVVEAITIGCRAFPKKRRITSFCQRLVESLCSGTLYKLEKPGFPDLSVMTGLSGVGLQLLRVEFDGIPSILVLEPPQARIY